MFKLDACNFITAIKSVRTLAQGSFHVKANDAGELVITSDYRVGLKEAKEFVEDIMAIGVQRYLESAPALHRAEREAEKRRRNEQAERLASWTAENNRQLQDDVDF
jgi:hypothetical protein